MSPSSLGLLSDCSRLWAARYRDGKASPRTPALLFGSAFDATVEWLLARKWAGRWSTAEEVAQQFARCWENEMERSEPVDWDGRPAASFLHDGIALCTAPATLACLRGLDPAPHPDDAGAPALQVRVELNVPGVPVPVVGYVDAILRDGPGRLLLVDFKTARRRWPRGRERKELQARVYLAALWQSGEPFSRLGFRYLVFLPGITPEGCAVQEIPVSLNEKDLLMTLSALRRSWQQIKSGVFPGNPHSWHCNESCVMWDECFG